MKPIQEAMGVVKEARKEVNLLLRQPEHSHVLLAINSLFTNIETRLVHMGAVLEPPKPAAQDTQFPPITQFMGKRIERKKPLTIDDLDPREEEKKRFFDKVDRLLAELGNFREPADVLKAYTLPEDILVIRGAAGKVKVKGFKNREVDAAFIEDIVLQKAIVEEEKAKQSGIDKTAKARRQTLTDADIDADPSLKKMKAEPGDTLVVDENGKKSIEKAVAQ